MREADVEGLSVLFIALGSLSVNRELVRIKDKFILPARLWWEPVEGLYDALRLNRCDVLFCEQKKPRQAGEYIRTIEVALV